MRRLALTAALAACGTSTQPAQPVATAPAPELAAAAAPKPVPDGPACERFASEPRVRRMLCTVAKARGLAPTRDVPGQTLARDDLLARVKAHVAREVPHQAIVDEGLVYQLLGALPTAFDYEKQTFALLEAQLAGYYEPADGTMYLAKDLPGGMADMTLSHELVHALQDHHFDLKARSKYLPGQSDLQTATSALAEGDATSAMIDVALAGTGRNALDLDASMFASLVRQSLSGDSTGHAPRVMSASLVAPYVDGVAFVAEMRKRSGWASVDAVWRDAPKSTEQILHPAKWDAHEPPLAVPAPAVSALGAAFAAGSPDTLGELALRTVLEEWMPEEKAAAAASGWGGDAAVLVKGGGATAFAWRVRWDAGAPADAFAARAFTAIASGPLAKAHVKEAAFACLARADRGPLAVMRKDRDVALVAGPAKTPEGAPWTSAGDCALARKWAAEILSR